MVIRRIIHGLRSRDDGENAEALRTLTSLGEDGPRIIHAIIRREKMARGFVVPLRSPIFLGWLFVSIYRVVEHRALAWFDILIFSAAALFAAEGLLMFASGHFRRVTDVHKSLALAISNTEEVHVVSSLVELAAMEGISADCDRAIARLLPRIETGSDAELSNRMLEKLCPKLQTGSYSLRIAILKYIRDHPNPHPPKVIVSTVYAIKEDTFLSGANADVLLAANECWEGLIANYRRGRDSSSLLRPAEGAAEDLLRPAGGAVVDDEGQLLRPLDS